MQIKVMLSGYGNVGYEIVKLLEQNQKSIYKDFGIQFLLVGIIGRDVSIYQEDGIQLNDLVAYEKGTQAIHKYSQKHHLTHKLPIFQGDVLIEATSTNIIDGQPGLHYVLQAMNSGMDIVFISKGALVTQYRNLMQLSEKLKVRLKYSGATAAALPTLDIGEYSLAGSKIEKIEGILNGTTNYILTRMFDQHISFEEALVHAKEKGIVETNSNLDIKGIDSACKLLLLCNRFFQTDFELSDIRIKGIDEITTEDLQGAKGRGNYIKLMAKASYRNTQVVAEVCPMEITPQHPLFQVTETNKGIVFETNNMGQIAALGGASHPCGAAAAALKDLINLYRQ